MRDPLPGPHAPAPPPAPAENLFAALEQAAGAVARLDQALDHHPLRPAFLYRARLEAVRRQAAVDGQGIDPWHLAAVLEGLRPRMDLAPRIVDRGQIFEAARAALTLHAWITTPDSDQERKIQEAERHLAAAPEPSALLAAATQTRAWLERGGTRPPIRAALIRFWVRKRLFRLPVPLTGARALAAEAPDEPAAWIGAFLTALAEEARDHHQRLAAMERAWLTAREKAAGRRSTSRAPMAVDVLAAAPLLSATTLARAAGLSIKSAIDMLDRFVADDIAVEVTHRAARRLFGLAGMAPLRAATAAPRRPEPGRGRGRPRRAPDDAGPDDGVPDDTGIEAPSAPPLAPRPAWPPIDYTALEAAMAQCEQVIGETRRRLAAIGGAAPAAGSPGQ